MLTPTEDWRKNDEDSTVQRSIEVMKFTLYFDGSLPSAANEPRLKEKHEIREKLHWQLLQLFRDHPALPKMKAGNRDWADWREWQWPFDQAWSEEQAVKKIGDLHFVPLVRETLHLTCELDILFLRKGEPGVMERGARLDIDNRLLTLFDGLALPNGDNAQNYAIAKTSLNRTSPIFCLLDDDSRIIALNVRTDSLLAPADGARAEDVRLIIGVTLKTRLLTFANMGLVS